MNILEHAVTVTQFVLGKKPAGRGLTLFPDDVFIVSYLR
jgi:hypothetical protein